MFGEVDVRAGVSGGFFFEVAGVTSSLELILRQAWSVDLVDTCP